MATFNYALNAPMPEACRRSVLTIGNFDGVHLGHQALLAEASRQGRLLGVPSIALTFHPHPSLLLRPDRVQPSLTTIEDRIALLQEYGVDHVLIVQTSPALLQLSAREFFEQIIIEGLQARSLVEGFSFGFGRGREGTVPVLKQLCAEKALALTLMPPCEVQGQPVSSSRVRTELLAGAVDVVSQLLGRPYCIRGEVGTGQKRGRSLGFPTANLHAVTTLIPGNGVYAVRAHHEHLVWPAAANIGPNPTFGEDARKIEVHLLGYAGNLYDQSLGIDFIARIRATRPFNSVQELTAQIQADIDEVRRILLA